MDSPDPAMMAAIAVTRFGLGARPGEIVAARRDPRGYLADQIRREGADQPQSDGDSASERFAALQDYREQRQAARQAGDPAQALKAAQKALRDETGDDFLARTRLAVGTPAGFRERWALFWANHFTVSATKQTTAVLIGPFEREALRPRVFGRFEDLLVAASSHPAMLTYLDQAQSIGPDSRAAALRQRRQNKQGGLNENLAREILELHTLGVDGGYSQADVTEFARAMTGWSIGRDNDPEAGAFLFRAAAHQPGARTILGKAYAQGDQDQALSVLRDLAVHPATARHLATKLARHFVADDPPPALVARLERRWRDTGGQLDAMARALIDSPEAWDPAARKIKTPYEFLISAYRMVDTPPRGLGRLAPILTSLGQKPFSPPSPKGWPEEAQAWAAPDALIKRMQWSQGFAAMVADRLDPTRLAEDALGARLTPPVAKAVARAETRAESVALLLMSPEFQRR
jgi:uncharacterized protein (DUF1800 family)